jgi:peptidoglycan hydrolase-like protein with peptidoglycan-binding domain
MEQRDKSMEKKSMEKMDKRMGSGSDRIGSAAGNGRMDREQVKRIQEALKDKGYDPGEIDGAMGPRTSAALREFQQAEGLRVTGRLDSDTRSKLGI